MGCSANGRRRKRRRRRRRRRRKRRRTRLVCLSEGLIRTLLFLLIFYLYIS